MNIQSVIASGLSQISEKSLMDSPITSSDAQKNFSGFLKDAIEKTNSSQITSDVHTQKLVRGEDVDLHEVMIAAQKATITLNTTMEVRNKVVEAYQEIIRMPV